jgi:hypothetical protein
MSQTLDLQAIAAFLSPSLQQNLDLAITVEIHRLESCLVINLTATEMLDQAETVGFIEADLSLFQLAGITIIRVCGWHRFEAELFPIWSQDLPRDLPRDLSGFGGRSPEPVLASFLSKSNPDLADYNASTEEIPEAKKSLGKKLLPLFFIPVGLGLGALLKLTSTVDFTAPDLPILPTTSIDKNQTTPTISDSPAAISITTKPAIAPTPATAPNLAATPIPGTAPIPADPNSIQASPNANPLLSPSLPPTVTGYLPGNPPANSLFKNDPKSAINNEPLPDLSKQIISLAQYNLVKPGMPLADVENIIGSTGRLIYENRGGSISTQIYSWKNPQGSNAIIEFRDGVVATKNQAGL